MRSTRRSLHATILSLLLTPFAAPHSVRAEDDYADEYDVKARQFDQRRSESQEKWK